MVKNEFTFLSADGKTPIHAVEWLPEGEVRGVVQLVHGVAEYIMRYEPFAIHLTHCGFAVVGHDHLSHGDSIAPGAPRLYFGPDGSWKWVVEDLHKRRALAKEKFPGVPYFLFGHSMGSFLSRTDLICHPGAADGAVLMGTGQMSALLVAGGLTVAAAEIRRLGEDQVSPLVEQLAFGAYNKRFAPNRTGYDWLSVSTENVDRYVADPLCGGSATVGLFREMLRGIRFITNSKNVKRMNKKMPVLFISGEMDPVGDCGKGVRRAFQSFLAAGMQDVTLQLYPGLRHEILQEDCREDVYAYISRWLLSRMPGQDGAFAVDTPAKG